MLGCCIGATFIFFHTTGHSQELNQTVGFEILGFTLPLNVAARPTGLAGAYVAAGNDVHSLVYNPAGLAQIKRIEVSLGIHQEYRDAKNVFYGNPTEVDSRSGGIDALSAAYPFPTYRGSLVAAFGVYRIYSSLFNDDRSGENTRADTIEDFLLQQSGSVYSYNVGLGIDLSPALSGGFSAFMIDGTVDALTQYDYTLLHWVPKTSVFVKDDVSFDLTGYGGRIGAQFFVHRNFSGGVCFTTPIWIRTKGNGVTEITQYRDNAADSFDEEVSIVNDDYLIPFRFDLGLAFSARNTLLAVEIGYSDWAQATINRERFRDGTTLETVFRTVYDYRAGAEVSIPWVPACLRAGYAYRPYPSKYLQLERIDYSEYFDGLVASGERIQKIATYDQRHQYSLGAGVVVGSILKIDAAYIYTTGERAIDWLTDESSSSRLLLSASYRF